MPIIEGNVGAVDVGIHQADLVAQRGEPKARFTETVVLPTPPLPDPTAIRFFTPGIGSFGIWPGWLGDMCPMVSARRDYASGPSGGVVRQQLR